MPYNTIASGGTGIKALVGRFFFWLMGWRLSSQGLPAGKKAVMIATPHTSNWDFIYLIAACWTLGLSISWLGKESLFRGSLGFFLRRLGGIAVRRGAAHGLVEQVIQRFDASDRMVLVVPAAGTRSARPHWKSGFYWIAMGAKVPIFCGYLDYSKREAVVGCSFTPTGQISKDMDAIRRFVAGKVGKYPDQMSAVCLKEEGRES